MQREEILTTVAGSDATSCLEVAVSMDSQGERKIELRRLSWGEGVGWYYQQTLRLDQSEAEGLLGALKGNRRSWSDRPLSFPGKVIPFPVPSADNRGQHIHPSGVAQKKRTGSPTSKLPVTEKRKTTRGEEKAATSHA